MMVHLNGLVLMATLCGICMLATMSSVQADIEWEPELQAVPVPIPLPCELEELPNEQERTLDSLLSGGAPVSRIREDIARLMPPIVRPLRCENGPQMILHSVPNLFYYPPIEKGSCANLACDTPPCLVRSQVYRTKCVHTWQYVNGRWIYRGRQTVRYLDHLKCGCKQCSDIRSQRECVRTRPCPNNVTDDTLSNYCYWKPFRLIPVPSDGLESIAASQNSDPEIATDVESQVYAERRPVGPIRPIPLGTCDCCQPRRCPPGFTFDRPTCKCVCRRVCRPPLVLNPRTCQCECPQGSWLSSTRDCIGLCEKIPSQHCSKVNCLDNQHLKCQLDNNRRCSCPSCDAITRTQFPLCSKTKCLEQPRKPKCVIDERTFQCRCPRCEDETDPDVCPKVNCGIGIPLNAPCTWDTRNRQCRCQFRG